MTRYIWNLSHAFSNTFWLSHLRSLQLTWFLSVCIVSNNHRRSRCQELNFDCQAEAAEALSRFAQGVMLLVQWQQATVRAAESQLKRQTANKLGKIWKNMFELCWLIYVNSYIYVGRFFVIAWNRPCFNTCGHQEELKRIDALEPKLPMLQLLCQAHHFFPYQRDQILHLLQERWAKWNWINLPVNWIHHGFMNFVECWSCRSNLLESLDTGSTTLCSSLTLTWTSFHSQLHRVTPLSRSWCNILPWTPGASRPWATSRSRPTWATSPAA